MLGRAALRGALAGLAGTAAMTLAEKAEQSVTHRPDSYVPARTLTALTTRRRLPGSARPLARNHLMHLVYFGRFVTDGEVLGGVTGEARPHAAQRDPVACTSECPPVTFADVSGG